MSSTAETLGKDIGNDIRNGKKTLIAVHALTNAEGTHRKVLKDIFGKATATDDEIQQVHHVFKDIGSIDYAKQKAVTYSNMAIESIGDQENLEPTSTTILKDLASYAITREK